MIRININIGEVQKRLNFFRSLVKDTTPLMRAVAGIMLNSTKKNFAESGRPRWVESARAKREGGKTLQDSGLLLRSLESHSGRNYAMVGTNMKYAAIHQFGGKTRPHIIRPRDKGGLYWPGAAHPFQSVNHPGSKIPARPFLLLTTLEEKKIEQAAIKYLGDAK